MKVIRLKESDIQRIVKRVLTEDSGQSSITKKSMEDEADIIKKATNGDFLKTNSGSAEVFFNKISKLQPNLTYKNFNDWGGKKTNQRAWNFCKENGTGCGGCAQNLNWGNDRPRILNNLSCWEDIIDFVKEKGDIVDLYKKLK